MFNRSTLFLTIAALLTLAASTAVAQDEPECGGFFECLDTCEDQTCFQDCADAAPDGVSEALAALVACAEANDCSLDDDGCWGELCQDEAYGLLDACGEEIPNLECLPIFECSDTCEEEGDYDCLRDCADASPGDGADAFIALVDCAEAACIDLAEEDIEPCVVENCQEEIIDVNEACGVDIFEEDGNNGNNGANNGANNGNNGANNGANNGNNGANNGNNGANNGGNNGANNGGNNGGNNGANNGVGNNGAGNNGANNGNGGDGGGGGSDSGCAVAPGQSGSAGLLLVLVGFAFLARRRQ